MIVVPIALVAVLLVFEKRLAPHVHRLIDWYAGVRPLSVEEAHRASMPRSPRCRRERQWGVRP